MLAALEFAPAYALAQTRFLSVMEDIPLPPGFGELPGAVVLSRDGARMAEARAMGPGAPEAALAYYEEALAALGWAPRPGREMLYLRGRERLSLGAETSGRRTLLRFTRIEPAPASSLD